MTFRSVVARTAALYLASLTYTAALLTQLFARHYAYPDSLGAPLVPYDPSHVPTLAGLSLALLASALAILLLAKNKRPAALGLLIAPVTLAAALGPVYPPHAFFLWLRAYDPRHLEPWRTAQLTFWILALIALLAALVYLAHKARGFRQKADTHGSAAWADDQAIEQAGLFAKSGIILGLWQTQNKNLRFLRSQGPHHVFVQGPPRSGKGVGIVQPTLLTWPGSVIVHDAKGELWNLTAGWRSRDLGSTCIRLDPTASDGSSASYNPLLEIRPGELEVADAQNLCDLLVDPQGDAPGSGNASGGAEQHFRDSAAELMLAAVLHILYAEKDKSLPGLVHFLSHPDRTRTQTLERMHRFNHDPTKSRGWTDPGTGEPSPTHPLVASIARGLMNREDRELSGVFSTAITRLRVYRDPVVAANVRTSDFRLEDLMDHDRPVSLYMTVPPSDLERARPLMRLFLAQALRRLTRDLELRQGRAVSPYRHELLLMLDEFPLLGRLPFLETALAVMPGYGIRACLITQGLSQHRAIYAAGGRHETILTTCDVRVALAANDHESAEYFSKLCGVFTVHQEKRSYRGSRIDLMLNKQYVSQHDHQRPLVYPDEILRLPDGDVLILTRGHRPVRARRVKRYEDKRLTARAEISSPPTSQVLPSPGSSRLNRSRTNDLSASREQLTGAKTEC